MKRIKEINWECRSKWSDLLKYEYRIISEWVKLKYFDLIERDEMLDLESIVILSREKEGYRIEFKIRTMFGKTIIGSRWILENVPYLDLIKMKKN